MSIPNLAAPFNGDDSVVIVSPGATWMQTYSGREIVIDNPKPEDICIEDIAHHLSMLCRFSGASRRYYSVAEHSVVVSHIVSQIEALPAVGLLHDAHEAYLGELITPVKHHVPEYKELVRKFDAAIAERFELPDLVNLPPEVKNADRIAFYHEAKDLMPASTRWREIFPPNFASDAQQMLRGSIIGLGPDQAEDLFITRCMEITKGALA